MKNKFSILFEELFPFIVFLINKHNKLNKIQKEGAPKERVNEYSTLSIDKLYNRLLEEHERAVKIDEKTAKFTLGLSVCLAILSTASGTFAKLLPSNEINSLIILLCGFSAVFMLIAGIISLGALKTLPRYGYGTLHTINTENKGVKYLAEVLILQEEINIVRHLRNEAAYQCLRNGFLLLLGALMILVFLMKMPIEQKNVTENLLKNNRVSKENIQKKNNVIEKDKIKLKIIKNKIKVDTSVVKEDKK